MRTVIKSRNWAEESALCAFPLANVGMDIEPQGRR